ncbi:MAG: sulfite exporter TauE/SafE family protein [Gammaproteobacteria bacterium]|nr:sulfite exporter TauE/SafE family protein [Gammaproteobacteria bacterium]
MDIAIAAFVIFVGSFVQSSIGFGLAIIAAPVLFFIDPLYVPAPITVSAFTLSLANAAKHWHSISFEGLKFAIIGRIPGTVAGGLLLFWISQEQLALWLGISGLAAVVLSLGNVAFKPTPGSLFSAGFLSGFMGTSSSIGGPPMALVLQHQENDFIRANMAAFFCVSCLMSLAMLATIDRFGVEHILISLPLMPATLLGYWVAMKTLHRISHQNLRRASLLLCTIAGVAAISSYFL